MYHLIVNLIGWFMRYVVDINMRRGFLDKRVCIETTFRLDYEKQQEENLLLSIIPKHIAKQVFVHHHLAMTMIRLGRKSASSSIT